MNPYLFNIIPNTNYNNYLEELHKLEKRVQLLEQKIQKIENNKENNYLKKDDNYYMI